MMLLNFNLIRSSLYRYYIIIDCVLYRIQSRYRSRTGWINCYLKYSNERYSFIKLSSSVSKQNNKSYFKKSNSFSRPSWYN
jgi:hypothetical protein